MGKTLSYNNGYQAGAIVAFLVIEQGVNAAGKFDYHEEDNKSFEAGYEAGFSQYM